MTRHEVLTYYIAHCQKTLADNVRAQRFLEQNGIGKVFVVETFRLGFSDGSAYELCRDNEQLHGELERLGLLKNGKEFFKGCITVPVIDENKEPVNIVGYNINAQKKERMLSLRPDGIFNAPFLKNCSEVIFTDNLVSALMLIASDIPNTTFVFGDEKKYAEFCHEHGIRKVLFTYDGSARLFHELTTGGISAIRKPIDFARLTAEKSTTDEIKRLIEDITAEKTEELSGDVIQEIEHGFLFRLPLLIYRVIGNFTDFTMSMKVNIKAMRDETVFVDTVDLYKNRTPGKTSSSAWPTNSISATSFSSSKTFLQFLM